MRCLPTGTIRFVMGSLVLILSRSRRNSDTVAFARPPHRSYLAPTSVLRVFSGDRSALLAARAKFSPLGWKERLHDA
ncbi:hypothetical protein D3C81_1674370 [compost metagenome]